MVAKLKGAVRRLGDRVPCEGPQGGGGRAALPHGRMRLPAKGADLSPGPRSCRRRRCPCHPGADAAAGWRLRTSGLMSCTRYVPPKPARPAARPRRRRRGHVAGALFGRATYTFSVQLAITLWEWDTLEGLKEAVASTWGGQSRDQRWDGAWPDPRDAPRWGSRPRRAARGLGAGTSDTLNPYCDEFEPDTRLFHLGPDTSRECPRS